MRMIHEEEKRHRVKSGRKGKISGNFVLYPSSGFFTLLEILMLCQRRDDSASMLQSDNSRRYEDVLACTMMLKLDYSADYRAQRPPSTLQKSIISCHGYRDVSMGACPNAQKLEHQIAK